MLVFAVFEPLTFIIIIISIILSGMLLFLLSCFIIVKKDRVAIIERMGQYVGTFKKGWYFYPPITYRRVGYYKIGETELRFEINKEKYKVVFEILDFEKYHYQGGHDAIGICRASLKDKNEDLSNLLIRRFESVGCRFISLDKIIK